MGPWVKDKEDIVSSLLLKFHIAQAFTVPIDASDFNDAVHRLAFGFVVCRVGDRCPIFKESVMAHRFFDAADLLVIRLTRSFMLFEFVLFQPMAGVGYKDYNWWK